MRLRTGDCTEQDWKLLLTRQPTNAPNLVEFQNATRLYFSNEEVANYNIEKLSALQHPIACVNARHSVITDWFFTQRLENFIKHWLYSSLDAEWHWYRFEYQARGSIHCHGVAKLKNDPGLCQLSETALTGYLAEMSIAKAQQRDIIELNEQILEGKKASQAVC